MKLHKIMVGIALATATVAYAQTSNVNTNQNAKVLSSSTKITLTADAYFDTDKFELKPAGKKAIAELAKEFNQQKAQIHKITILGHTDNRGSAKYNQRLSERRAQAVANFLIENGVPSRIISTRGYGFNSPIASNDTPQGMALNRRADIIVDGAIKIKALPNAKITVQERPRANILLTNKEPVMFDSEVSAQILIDEPSDPVNPNKVLVNGETGKQTIINLFPKETPVYTPEVSIETPALPAEEPVSPEEQPERVTIVNEKSNAPEINPNKVLINGETGKYIYLNVSPVINQVYTPEVSAIIQEPQEEPDVNTQKVLINGETGKAIHIKLSKKPEPKLVKFKEKLVLSADAYFDFDKYALKEAGKKQIFDVAQKFRNKDAKITSFTVIGHTDSRGTDQYNQILSEKRAKVVRDYLIANGVPAGIIKAIGKGEREPIASNSTDEGRALNRRTEIVIDGVIEKEKLVEQKN